MSVIWTKLFWKDVTERAIATAAQLLIALLTADGVNVLSLDWQTAAVTIVTALVLVVLKAVVAAQLTTGVRSVSPASFAKE